MRMIVAESKHSDRSGLLVIPPIFDGETWSGWNCVPLFFFGFRGLSTSPLFFETM